MECKVWVKRTCSLLMWIAVNLIILSPLCSQHPEFSFLLKERVCALVIKLFSPNIKYRNTALTSSGASQQTAPLDKPYFPISVRLLRVVSILVQKYHVLLVRIFVFLVIAKKRDSLHSKIVGFSTGPEYEVSCYPK